MKKNPLLIHMNVGLAIAVILTFLTPTTAIMNNLTPVENPTSQTSQYMLTMEQAKEMIQSHKVLLVQVEDQDNPGTFLPGAMGVSLPELGCSDCLENALRQYTQLIVYSSRDDLRTQASDILRKDGYTVYELIDVGDALPTEENGYLSKDKVIQQIDKSLAEKVPVFLFFFAEWCGYCKRERPIYEKLKIDYDGKIVFLDINAEKNTELSDMFGVSGFPTMFLITGKDKDGYVKEKYVGFNSEILLKGVFDKTLGITNKDIPNSSPKIEFHGSSEWALQDMDGDGIQNGIDPDNDNDGIPDDRDTVISLPSPNQAGRDSIGDGILINPIKEIQIEKKTVTPAQRLGSPDQDSDSDGIYDDVDNCRYMHNILQEDSDGNGIGDVCDVLPADECSGLPMVDINGDGINDLCDYPSVRKFEVIMDDLLGLVISNPDPQGYHNQIISLLEESVVKEISYQSQTVHEIIFFDPDFISLRADAQYFFDKQTQAINLMQAHGQELGVAAEYNQICQKLAQLAQVLTKLLPAAIEVDPIEFVDSDDTITFNIQLNTARSTSDQADVQLQAGNWAVAEGLYEQSYLEMSQALEVYSAPKTFMVGPAGGTIYSVDGSLIMTIPAGALRDTVDFSISMPKWEDVYWQHPDVQLPPVTNVYIITPQDYPFASPVTVSLFFNDVSVNTTEDTVKLLFFNVDDGVIQNVFDASLNTETSIMTAQIQQTPSSAIAGAPYSVRGRPGGKSLTCVEGPGCLGINACYPNSNDDPIHGNPMGIYGFTSGHHLCGQMIITAPPLSLPLITQQEVYVSQVSLERVVKWTRSNSCTFIISAVTAGGGIAAAAKIGILTLSGGWVIPVTGLAAGTICSVGSMFTADIFACINELLPGYNCNERDSCNTQDGSIPDIGRVWTGMEAADYVCNRGAAAQYKKYEPMQGGFTPDEVDWTEYWCPINEYVYTDCVPLFGTKCGPISDSDCTHTSRYIDSADYYLYPEDISIFGNPTNPPCRKGENKIDYPTTDILYRGLCQEYLEHGSGGQFNAVTKYCDGGILYTGGQNCQTKYNNQVFAERQYLGGSLQEITGYKPYCELTDKTPKAICGGHCSRSPSKSNSPPNSPASGDDSQGGGSFFMPSLEILFFHGSSTQQSQLIPSGRGQLLPEQQLSLYTDSPCEIDSITGCPRCSKCFIYVPV